MGVRWNGIRSLIAHSHIDLVYIMTVYTLCHCMLYKEGIAALLSLHLVLFITVNACVHGIE